MDHLVWIRDGGSWRMVAAYDNATDARMHVRDARRDGDRARYARRGDETDLSLRANVMQD